MKIFRSESMYRSDSGQVFKVCKMTASHLVNVIGHHQKQLDTIDQILKDYDGEMTHLKVRRADIDEAIEVLTFELIERDPDDDHKRD